MNLVKELYSIHDGRREVPWYGTTDGGWRGAAHGTVYSTVFTRPERSFRRLQKPNEAQSDQNTTQPDRTVLQTVHTPGSMWYHWYCTIGVNTRLGFL